MLAEDNGSASRTEAITTVSCVVSIFESFVLFLPSAPSTRCQPFFRRRQGPRSRQSHGDSTCCLMHGLCAEMVNVSPYCCLLLLATWSRTIFTFFCKFLSSRQSLSQLGHEWQQPTHELSSEISAIESRATLKDANCLYVTLQRWYDS